jgi:hypothetical protein
MHVMNRLRGFRLAMALAAVLFTAGAAVAADPTVTVDPNGDLNGPRTIATVSITTQCTLATGQSAAMTVYIFQSVGRLINIGIVNNLVPTCDGTDQVSLVDVSAIPGLKFQPGPATVLVSIAITSPDDGDPATPETTTFSSGAKVKLHP